MTSLSDHRFFDLFVDVVHNKIDHFWCEQLGSELVVIISISVKVKMWFEDMLRFSLQLFEGAGQMITVCFDNK